MKLKQTRKLADGNLFVELWVKKARALFVILLYLFVSRAAREAAIWELEKQQLHEKHQLAKSQLKDMFFLKRHQMLTRHQKVCT